MEAIRTDSPEARRDARDLRALSREIRAVLDDRVTGIWDSLPGVEDTFYEGCYCLCAAQNPAVRTARAVEWLRGIDAYGRLGRPGAPPRAEIAAGIRGLVRFHNVKSGWIALLRGQIAGLRARLAGAGGGEGASLRDRLIREVKGFGPKEASHFLRNVGFRGLAILDVHVLRRLSELGLVEWPYAPLTPLAYRDAERGMYRYAEALGATVDELDVLWWSRGSGGFGR